MQPLRPSLRWAVTATLLLVSLAALAAQRIDVRPDGSVVLEAATPALGSDGHLREHIGFETLGRSVTPVLEQGSECPCERTVSYSTALDRQTEIPIRVYRGTSERVEDSHPLGAYEVSGVRALPRGQAHVRVTLRIAAGRIELRAVDAADGRVLPIQRLD